MKLYLNNEKPHLGCFTMIFEIPLGYTNQCRMYFYPKTLKVEQILTLSLILIQSKVL